MVAVLLMLPLKNQMDSRNHALARERGQPLEQTRFRPKFAESNHSCALHEQRYAQQ
jgi:hypothetical protein